MIFLGSKIEIKTIAWVGMRDGYFVGNKYLELLCARACANDFGRFSCVRARTRENENKFQFLYLIEIQRIKTIKWVQKMDEIS